MADSLILKCLGSGQGAYFVDGGRPGYRNRGVILGGPADKVAVTAINNILGQPANHPTLEMTLFGGHWQLTGKGQIALGGANINWTLNNTAIDRYTLVNLDGNYTLSGGFTTEGCRAYLGVRGEWHLPLVLGSAEKGLPGVLSPNDGNDLVITSTTAAPTGIQIPYPNYPDRIMLRGTTGPEWKLLTVSQQCWLSGREFTVSPCSDRQGIRLVGELPTSNPPILLSSPVLPGTVQLTPGGLILLGPDAHTVGGYPRVLQVDDYAAAFQLRLGGRLQFDVER